MTPLLLVTSLFSRLLSFPPPLSSTYLPNRQTRFSVNLDFIYDGNGFSHYKMPAENTYPIGTT